MTLKMGLMTRKKNTGKMASQSFVDGMILPPLMGTTNEELCLVSSFDDGVERWGEVHDAIPFDIRSGRRLIRIHDISRIISGAGFLLNNSIYNMEAGAPAWTIDNSSNVMHTKLYPRRQLEQGRTFHIHHPRARCYIVELGALGILSINDIYGIVEDHDFKEIDFIKSIKEAIASSVFATVDFIRLAHIHRERKKKM